MFNFWNVGSDDLQSYFSSVSCDSFYIDGALATDNYVCSFLDSDRVEIDGAFLSNEVPENTDISVRIQGFRNPI